MSKRNRKKSKRTLRRRKIEVLSKLIFLVCVIGIFIFIWNGKEKKPEKKAVQKKDLEVTSAIIERNPVEVSISMVGDVLLNIQVQKSGLHTDGTYNYDHIFQHIKSKFAQMDINIVNQEIILGGSDLGLSGYPAFNGAFEVGDAIANAGGNVVLHATNHAIDKGEKGVDNCMNFWKEKHPEVAVLGINDSQEAQDNNIYIYEKEGLKIAILNYTYGTNGIPIPSDKPYIVNLLDKQKIESQLEKANELADFIVVCPHWGTEYQFQPNEGQKEWAKFFVERGVDLIIGTHPHVIQPVEWVESGENKMLVYYSLGNFISRQDTAKGMVGAMADVTILKDGKGSVSIKEYGVEPLVTHIADKTEYTTYFLKNYTQSLAARNKIRAVDAKFNLQYCRDLSRQVFGELYKE